MSLGWDIYRTAMLWEQSARLEEKSRRAEQRRQKELQKEYNYRYANDAIFREAQDREHIREGVQRASNAYRYDQKTFKRKMDFQTRIGLTSAEFDSLTNIDVRNRRISSENDQIIRMIAEKAGVRPEEYFNWLCNKFWQAYDNGEVWVTNY